MDFRGESIAGDISSLQSQIDALDTRVTSLETRMTTAESNITTLQSGVFTGRVYQYTSLSSPFMIAELTGDVNMPNSLTIPQFVTPDSPHLELYYKEGSVFHFFTCGSMDGASTSLQFFLSNDVGATNFGSVNMTLTAGLGTPHWVSVEAFLMIYNIVSPTSAKAKLFIRGYCSQSGSGTPPSQVECVEAHNISLNPSTGLGTMSLWKLDQSALTTYTRTQGWVMCLS